MHIISTSSACILAGVIGLLAVTGCRGPAAAVPAAPVTATFSEAGEAAMPGRWWEAFEDEHLNHEVERALEGNFSLLVAWERLQGARALARQAAAGRQPLLDGVGRAGYEDDSEEGSMREFSVGLEASYEVDLWGAIRSRAEAERLRASAAQAAYRAAALSLSAEVALAWYGLAEAQSQYALLEAQHETNETVLQLLEWRFAAGLIRSADVLRQRLLVEATREQSTVVQSRIGVLQHQLAVLQGRAPRSFAARPPGSVPDVPPVPATGLPGELVERRPDVRQAYHQAASADRDLAAALSERYPRINLTASLTSVAERPGDLFSEWLSSVVGDLVAPLWAGGALAAEVERTKAAYRERLAEYGQAVLTAFQEVENALVRERQQQARLASLERQLELSRRTYQELQVQYLNGVTDYLAVLASLTQRQRLERDLTSARLALVEFRIALYRALAGGFETERERNEEDATRG